MNNIFKKVEMHRSTAQKGLEHDEFFCYFLLRPFSLYFSYFLYTFTSISANTITYVMFVASFLLPILVYILADELFYIYLSFSYFLVLFLDQLDGEVARLRKVFSKKGYFLDLSLWFTLSIFSVALFVYLEQTQVISSTFLWSLISLEFVFLYLSVFDYLRSETLVNLFDLKSDSFKHPSEKRDKFLTRFLKILPQKNMLFLSIPFYFFLDQINSIYFLLHLYTVFMAYTVASFLKLRSLLRFFDDL